MPPTVTIAIISVANLCLLVTAALYPESESLPQVSQSRRRAGLMAVFLGLGGQSLYLLFFGWTYLHPETRISQLWITTGGWCSITTFVVALFGKKLKRYPGLASGVTMFFLWGLAGLGNLLSGH
jgi:hypothetical protein